MAPTLAQTGSPDTSAQLGRSEWSRTSQFNWGCPTGAHPTTSEAMIRRIAINTGGGDAPGLNAVIHAVALSALRRGWEVLGIRRGYEGLLDGDVSGIIPLTREAVRGIAHMGGTILGT